LTLDQMRSLLTPGRRVYLHYLVNGAVRISRTGVVQALTLIPVTAEKGVEQRPKELVLRDRTAILR